MGVQNSIWLTISNEELIFSYDKPGKWLSFPFFGTYDIIHCLVFTWLLGVINDAYVCFFVSCQLQDHHPVHWQSVWAIPPRWEWAKPKAHSGQQGALLFLLHISIWTWVNKHKHMYRHQQWGDLISIICDLLRSILEHLRLPLRRVDISPSETVQ